MRIEAFMTTAKVKANIVSISERWIMSGTESVGVIVAGTVRFVGVFIVIGNGSPELDSRDGTGDMEGASGRSGVSSSSSSGS